MDTTITDPKEFREDALEGLASMIPELSEYITAGNFEAIRSYLEEMLAELEEIESHYDDLSEKEEEE